MKRRSLVLGSIALLAIGQAPRAEAAAPGRVLSGLWAQMSYQQRVAAQQELRAAGLYSGAIDAIYGPGTQTALIAGAARVRRTSGGSLGYDLTRQKGGARFLRDLVSGRLRRYL